MFIYMSNTCNKHYNHLMSKVTLGYWTSRGRGQIPRLLLAYTGTKFEERKYKQQNQWFGEERESLNLDFPNLPYLIDGDVRLTESRAISYYIIEKSKRGEQLLGKDVKQRSRIMNVVEVILDIFHRVQHIVYDSHFHSKRETIWKQQISPKLKQLATFRGNKEWLFDRVTLADFVLSELSHYIETVFPNEYKNLQFLHEQRQRFLTIPEIKSYYERQDSVKGPFVEPHQAHIKF